MVDAPCSRVGHIYRCKYIPFPNPGVGDFISRNYKRVAEVWMDEYKEHLYKRRPVMKNTNEGNAKFIYLCSSIHSHYKLRAIIKKNYIFNFLNDAFFK